MALIKCPDCGKMFSEFADSCPECGCPVDDAKAANRQNDPSLPQSEEGSSQESSIAESEKQDSTTVSNSLNHESEGNDEAEVEDAVEQTHDFSKYYGYGILVVVVITLLIIGLVNRCKSIPTASEAEVVIDTITTIKQTKEEQILERANYIFKNIPDHRDLEEVDKTVFTPTFLDVLEKAFALDRELEEKGDLSMEAVAYWYLGQDGSPDDGLRDISVISYDDNTAYVKVEYKNFEVIEHRMKLVCSDGQWYCDNWDDMKEDLQRSMEQITLSNIVSSNGTQEKMEEIQNHEWGNKMLHHHLVGTMSDETGKHPIELDFDYCNEESDTIENVIYKNVELGGRIKMDGEVSRGGLLIFSGKDGNLNFIIRIDPSDFEGESFVGDKHLTVSLMPQCNHSSAQ